jgi:hypothetical protein
MTFTNASKKINVVTLTGQDRKPLSFENALGALARLLMTAPLQQLAQTLAEISSVLHDKSWAEAESHLRKQFCSPTTIEAIIPLDDEKTVNYLFSHSALYILNTLLTFNISLTTQEAYCYIIHESEKGLSFAGSHKNVALPIAEIFLMTNQLLLYLEKDLNGIALDYSRNRGGEEIFTAISKAKHLYDVPYFNDKFIRHLGYTIPEWATYQFILITAVKTAKPAKIELDVSFNKLKEEIDKSRVKELVKMLAFEAKSVYATLDEVARILRNDFVLDNQCRGKPFLKVGQRYICIRQDLLTSSTDSFPYYYLLSAMTEEEKKTLFAEFGDAFEKRYIPMISKKVLGQRIEPNTYEDLCASITDQSKLILEIKSGRANDAVKTGAKQALIEKYVRLKNSKGKSKGVIQSLKQAARLRSNQFSGEIFTGIIFYNLPFNDELDRLITQELESTKEYVEYRRNLLNHPPIWMDVLAYELLLLTVQQGLNLYDILKQLSGLPPSETRRAIVSIMQKAGLKISIHPLYAEEIKELQERCKEMLLREAEILSP